MSGARSTLQLTIAHHMVRDRTFSVAELSYMRLPGWPLAHDRVRARADRELDHAGGDHYRLNFELAYAWLDAPEYYRPRPVNDR